MNQKEVYKETLANTIIKNLETRNMEGYYVKTAQEAREKVLSLMEDGSSVSWGGSATLVDAGIIDAVYESGKYKIIDRDKADDRIQAMHEALSCDNFLMSTNAITFDGQLVNIDGMGNRLAALIFGPKNVIVVAGMNKCSADLDSAMKRARNKAAVTNAIRFGTATPCTKTGSCHDCKSPETVCCQFVTTRYSKIKNRIKVVLVGEDFGY